MAEELKSATARTPVSGDKVWGTDSSETAIYEYQTDRLVTWPITTATDTNFSAVSAFVATPMMTATNTSWSITAEYCRGNITYVRDIAWDNVNVYCRTAGSGSDEIYVMAFNIDGNGHPTTVAAEWGPFDVTSTGQKTLTGQTETLTAGWYYWAIWAGSLTGSPKIDTVTTATVSLAHSISNAGDVHFTGQTTKPTDLTSVTANAAGGHYAPFMTGHD